MDAWACGCAYWRIYILAERLPRAQADEQTRGTIHFGSVRSMQCNRAQRSSTGRSQAYTAVVDPSRVLRRLFVKQSNVDCLSPRDSDRRTLEVFARDESDETAVPTAVCAD